MSTPLCSKGSPSASKWQELYSIAVFELDNRRLPQRHVWERYGVALASAVLAILMRGLLEPWLGHAGFYVTVYLAVVYSAAVCGLWPSVLTGVVGTTGIVYWFVDPRNSFGIADTRDIHGLIACVIACVALIALGDANRRKQLRLNQAHEKLEQRVEERTADLSQALANVESEMKVRKRAEEQLRSLTAHLMTIQDEERRRIARDLHDTAGQTLAAIKMSLDMLQRAASSAPHIGGLVDDLNILTDEALQEIRTTSYLLHPPYSTKRDLRRLRGGSLKALPSGAGFRCIVICPTKWSAFLRRLNWHFFACCRRA